MKSNWRDRDCAVCGGKATTEKRSRLDMQIRPYCHLCRSRNAEPVAVVQVALADMSWEALPLTIKDVITVLSQEGEYVTAVQWAADLMERKLMAIGADEEIEERVEEKNLGRILRGIAHVHEQANANRESEDKNRGLFLWAKRMFGND